jgi:hypothetical protein
MSIEQTFEKIVYTYRNKKDVYYVLAERDPRESNNLSYYVTRDGHMLSEVDASRILEEFKAELAGVSV